MDLKYDYTIWITIHLLGVRQHLLVISPDACNRWGLSRGVSHGWWEHNSLSHPHCLPGSTGPESWSPAPESSIEPRLSDVGCRTNIWPYLHVFCKLGTPHSSNAIEKKETQWERVWQRRRAKTLKVFPEEWYIYLHRKTYLEPKWIKLEKNAILF